MKIFSSFDTNLKKDYIESFTRQYGAENIVIIRRSNLYFLKKVVSHILLGTIAYIILSVVSYYLIGEENALYYPLLIPIPFALFFFITAIENYMDYSMNYAIFTPNEATLVEQLWLFKRNIKSLDITKIKSISIKKSNRIYSLFNDGLLTIFNEWSASHAMGEIIFKYVYNPEEIKSKIEKIISYAKQRIDPL